jgi:carbonic anhydrase
MKRRITVFPTFYISRLSLFGLLLAFVLSCPVLSEPADDALQMLKDGNDNFVAGKMLHPNSSPQRVQETAGGQKPFAIIFDTGIGDIFVVRDAGNIADPVITGSIEYAVGHLHVPLVVVMGHTKCGAVGAAVAGGTAGGSIDHILGKISPAVKTAKTRNPGMRGDLFNTEVSKINVANVASEIIAESLEIAEGIHKSEVKVMGAVYDVSDGRVSWLEISNEQPKQAPKELPKEHAKEQPKDQSKEPLSEKKAPTKKEH